MKFYELPPAVNNSIQNTDIRPYVRILFELNDEDLFIPNSDILECVITSYKSVDGGIINNGYITLNNKKGLYTQEANPELTTDLHVQIWYCFGNNENTFHRFSLIVDENGFQNQETGFLDKTTTVKLVDLSTKLDSKKTQKNWTDTQTVVHSVVCDKENPDNSLVHIIAKRAGLEPSQINCGHLPFNLPFTFIDNTAWKELCALARAYNACVECGKDMALSFTESPYDTENTYSEDSEFFLTEKDITHFRFFNNNESYANSIRLKYTRYVETERQELWTYDDSPVWFNENMEPYYPFTGDTRKIISDNDYTAIYTAKNKDGKTRNVVFAEEIDDVETFLNNMITEDNKKFEVIQYDTTTYKDRAIIQLSRNGELIGLYKASIYGKAIISETNFSCFVKDDSEIKEHGQIVKNVTSKYLSDDLIENVPFYEHRANDLLNESKKDTKGYYLTTYLPLIHARVDACMDIRLRTDGNVKKVRLEEITFRYKKEAAFSTEMWVKTV